MHKIFCIEREGDSEREMGNPNSQAEPAAIQHFSHQHPLQLSNHQPQQTLNLASCSGCKLKASGWMYSCQMCHFFLHVKCSQMPQQIKHPFDQKHVFSLLAIPIYPEGFFNCDACGVQGNGFSYHCQACSIDIHLLCASKPLSITHQSHHHQLNLTFSPPYQNRGFSCDICKNMGSNHWLYRCNLCGFDAHLNCAAMELAAPVQAPIQSMQTQQYQTRSTAPIQPIQMQPFQTTSTAPLQVQMQPFQTTSRAIPQFQAMGTQYGMGPSMQNYPPNNLVNHPGVFGSVTQGVNGQNNGLTNQAMQGLVTGAAQAAGKELFMGFMGGGRTGGGLSVGGGGHLFQPFMGGGVDGTGGALDGNSFVRINDGCIDGVDLGGMGDGGTGVDLGGMGGYQDYSTY